MNDQTQYLPFLIMIILTNAGKCEPFHKHPALPLSGTTPNKVTLTGGLAPGATTTCTAARTAITPASTATSTTSFTSTSSPATTSTAPLCLGQSPWKMFSVGGSRERPDPVSSRKKEKARLYQ